MKHTLKKILIFLVLFVCVHEVIIISDGLIDNASKTRVAVIFGSKVNSDGTLSQRLKARLDAGLKLYKQGLVVELYVSGGLGKEGYYEGDVMADYLILNGVPKNVIQIDNKGTNTRHTALNFRKDYPSESSVILVTQYFHITRCKLAFIQLGIKDVTAVHAEIFEIRDVYSSLRELAGFYKYLIYY